MNCQREDAEVIFRVATPVWGARRRLARRPGSWMLCALVWSVVRIAFPVCATAVPPDPTAVAFGTMPGLWNVRMSPDGSKVSLLQMHPDELPILTVLDLITGKANLALASTKDGFDIRWCDWANNERLLCGFGAVKRGWNSYGVTRLVAVNADGSQMKVLLQRKLENEFAQFQDAVVDWLVDDPNRVLVIVPTHTETTLSPLDIYSGATGVPVARMSGPVYWITDGRGSPRLYWHMKNDEIRWYFRLPNERKWRILDEHEIDDHDFYPIGLGDSPDQVLVLKPNEGRLALWSVDLTGEKDDEIVFSHPEVDVDGPEYLGKFSRIVAIGYSTDRPHLHFFDDTVKKISDGLTKRFDDKQVGVISESWDRRYYIVHVGSDRDAGTFYRFDVEQNQLLELSPQYPKLESRSLAEMKPIRYPAREGTEIPGYLTLPIAAQPGALPTVILPHGGPESRDYWEFDWIVQFLAANGYAVLQSNYRGSGGYGSDWAGKGGFRAWRTAVSDLTDGAQYLVDQGISDPARICVVGWSYGGYAALMSGVEEPDRYRCLVSIAGVTDPGMLIDDYRRFTNRKAVRKFIGNDDEVLEHGSPLKRASQIRAPVLLFHGDLDLNVSVGHSQKMAKALERAKKSVDYIEYEDVEHSIRRNGYRVDMLDRIGAFLDAHIGQSTASP
jgi:dipeptidyl aminopeptidase/acylaminoacyl peptidase